MSRTHRRWQRTDFQGAGLQAFNLRLAQRLKKPRHAYLLWLLFPSGAHRFYLEERVGALFFLGCTALAILLWLTSDSPLPALAPALAASGLALHDLAWIGRRITSLNKQTRMALYLGGGATPPPGYRGRRIDDASLDAYPRVKGSEKPGAAVSEPNGRAPSLAEQEALLRKLARMKRDRDR